MGIQLAFAARITAETVYYFVYSLLKTRTLGTITEQTVAEVTRVSSNSCSHHTSEPQRKSLMSELIDSQTPTWNRGAEGHEHHRCDRVFETYGAAEMAGQVPGHSCQNANEGYGHEEAGPSVPVLSGWDESEEDFPENCQEMHYVIKAGWQALLPALFLVIVT